MQRPFDLTETRRLLRRGVEVGHWTVEDLDTPSSGWQENAKRFRLNYPKYQQHEYRNPLRDAPEPEIQLSESRDFTPATGTTPAEASDLPYSPPPALNPAPAAEFDF